MLLSRKIKIEVSYQDAKALKSTNKVPHRIVPKNIVMYCTRFMGLAAGLFRGRS